MDTDTQAYDLTVITVCWNVKEHILPTVECVERQKGMGRIRIEHLFVDGASKDGSADLLRELHAAGRVEAYVSEPDKGIYDAMNKGIRMARGKVLYFLNAGDMLLDGADLSRLVLPIVRDECDATCGYWKVSNKPDAVRRANFKTCAMETPCNHQAFFMSKAWYEKLGGYNDKEFRCMADADVMWRMYAAGGRVEVIDSPTAMFLQGGFSQECDINFLNELTRICQRHGGKVAEMAYMDPDFQRYMIVRLAMLVYCFARYAPQSKDVQGTHDRLQWLYGVARSIPGHFVSKLMLRIMCGPGLRAFSTGKTGKLRILLLWRLPALFLTWPKDGGYASRCWRLPLLSRLSRQGLS